MLQELSVFKRSGKSTDIRQIELRSLGDAGSIQHLQKIWQRELMFSATSIIVYFQHPEDAEQ